MLSPVFLAHGSPYTIFEKSKFTKFLNYFDKEYRPKAIVIFSAPFESEITTIAATDYMKWCTIITDISGRVLSSPTRGSTIVASIVEERLRKHDIPVRQQYRGLDHGVFPIMKHAYPDADIPIVPVSVNPNLPARQQIALGKALQGLENEGSL